MQYRKGPGHTVRVKDLAALAGVSPTTVSNVIHGRTDKVSAATVKRVRSLLEETGYVSDMAPRILSGNGSRLIAVIVGAGAQGSARQDACQAFLRELEQELYRKNYYMLPHFADEPEEILRFAAVWHAEGLLTLGLAASVNQRLQAGTAAPVISVDTYYDQGPSVINVGTDDFEGGCLTGLALLETGHRAVRYLADSGDGPELARWEGLKIALAEGGVFLRYTDFIRIPRLAPLRERFYRRRLAELARAADAFVFSADYYAAETLGYLADMGIRVPVDLSVVGFGDEPYALLTRPRLTTVRQDPGEKARAAAACLLSVLCGEKEGTAGLRLPVRLVRRESVRDRRREKRTDGPE